jgi:hypothetical protein
VTFRDRPAPVDEELLNRAAVDVITHGGTVFAVPAGEVPGGGPLAAIYWLPHAAKKQGAAAP